MRGFYIVFGLILMAAPTYTCGLAIDILTDQQSRWGIIEIEKLPTLLKDGFKVSSPVSVPLAILGSILLARGVTGRCIRRRIKHLP
jgi:hypothetical protein